MTKNDFIKKLRKSISHLPPEEIEKSINFYSESIEDRIEDGMTEEEAVSQLGDYNKLVENINLGMSLPVLVKAKIKKSHEKSNSKTLWVVLAVLGTPFWIPVIAAFVAAFFGIYLAIWAVIFSLYVVLLSLGVAGIGGFISGLVNFFVTNPLTGIMLIGIAIACIGLLLLSIRPIFWLTKKLTALTVYFIKKVKSLFITYAEVKE